MKHLQRLDHIGYAVNDLETTAKHYLDAGWKGSPVYEETTQHSRIMFLTKEGFPKIELVASDGKGRFPAENTLKTNGVAPYHLCYEVDDVMEAMEALYEEGFVPMFMPVESVAMNGKKICYLCSLEVGTIEIVSK
jgi:methylmalonyl-CoA/ethylmalonyl-CoA epimerase